MLNFFALLFALLSISNFLKPLQLSSEVGFVLFGERLSGTANAIAGPVFGLFLATYAFGIWKRKAWALPMGVVYAAYVIANLVLFQFRMPAGAESSLAFSIAYCTVAVGVSSGAAWMLAQNRDTLG